MPGRRCRGLGGRAAAALAVALAGLAACGGDDDEPAVATTTTEAPAGASSSTTAAGASTTASSLVQGGEQACAGGVESSPATFDPSTGLYAAYLTALDPAAGEVRFDVVQWLGGEAAKAAYLEDHPDETDGPPNDFYIVNASPEVRRATVAPGATVRVLGGGADGGVELRPATLAELPGHLAGGPDPGDGRLSANPYWLGFQGGTVTSICEQYVP